MSVEQNPAGHVTSTPPWGATSERGWQQGVDILSVTVTVSRELVSGHDFLLEGAVL